jgi:diguanylate cyclase (GGDEF)-like protein/PAS domain S-box-containing protein
MSTNILLIEDNPVNVEYIRAMINKKPEDTISENRINVELSVATTLQEGVDILDSRLIQLVLLDLSLPDSSGIQSIKTIQKINDRIPIIVLTGVDDTDLASEAINQGAQDYLVKGKINKTLLDRSIQYAFQRMKIHNALMDSESRYMIALKATNDGIWEWNLKENFLYYSPRWKEIIGYSEDDLSNEPSEWFDRIHPDDVFAVEEIIANHLAGDTKNLVTEHRLLHKNGTYIWVRVHGLAVLDHFGSVLKIAGSLSDITGEKFIDSLTGLPSLSLFTDRVQSAIQRVHDEKKFGFVLIKLEFEQLKFVANTYGAGITNEVVQTLINRIKLIVKPADTIGRLEGLNFGIILSGVQELYELNRILDNIQTVVSKPLELNNNQISISASMGVLFGNIQYDKAEDMLRDVDSALHKALLSGRSNREVFESAMRDQSIKVLHLEGEMRRALERDEFVLVYQPIVSLKQGKIISMEALIRWQKQDGTVLSPNFFIPIAEESDMIIRIGAWVIEESILQVQKWIQAGIEDVSVSINLSARQFLNWNMVNYLKHTIEISKVPVNLVEVEVTESAAMKDIELSKKILDSLSQFGISISLDDFGTGYSSLNYLKQFPISKMKLDQSFIKEVPGDRESEAIVSALITLGHALDQQIVVEGVENQEQFNFVKEHGADLVQGYFISRPVTLDKTKDCILNFNSEKF